MSNLSPLVEAFPNDDKEYVVWAFGCLKKNTSDKSITPLVEVALTEIRPTGKLANHSNSYLIPVTELDIVHIWSIWKNKKKLDKVWKKLTSASFEFDVSKDNFEPLTFFSKRPNSSEYYIPRSIYNFNNLDQRGPSVNSYRVTQKRHYFQKAKITKLITYRGVEVLIPSLELFSSIYTPHEKEIRRKLLTKSFEDVITDYVNIDDCYEKDGEYHISLKTYKEESNIHFLAYLALNKITRKKVSKLWSSLMAGEGSYFPAIEPYHAGKFIFWAEGVWLKEKQTFLVICIKKYTLPHEIKINVTYPEKIRKIKKPSGNRKKRVSKYQKELFREVAFSGDFDPGITQSPVYLTSDVEIVTTKVPVIKRMPPKESQEYSSSKVDLQNVPYDKLNNVSSGELTCSQDNQATAKLKTVNKDEVKDNIIEVIYKTLLKLRDKRTAFSFLMSNTTIKNIITYNENGKEFVTKGFGTFPQRLIEMKKVGAWSIIKVNRKPKSKRRFLLAKVVLDNDKSAYLLEVQRRPTEKFCGLIFQIKDNLITNSNIEELLIAIATTKGKLTYHTESEDKIVFELKQLRFISNQMTFSHFAIQDNEKNLDRMSFLLQTAIHKDIFS